MGVASRLRDIRPPLPAPTESNDEGGASGLDTDVATNITSQTDKTSYEIPEDGKPIKISAQKVKGKEAGASGHGRDRSQTSLLIEYFEGAKGTDKTKSRPSVRVKVTPSSRKKSGSGGPDAVQITNIGKDRKTSYTRRISLSSSKNAEVSLAPPEGTEFSHSSDSNLSSKPQVEIEVPDQNGSDLSTVSRGLMYAPNESNVSSMPADSMLEGNNLTESERSRAFDRDDDITVRESDYLQAPEKSRERSASRERIAQKVMEKLGQGATKPRKSSKSRSERSLGDAYERERSSKSRRYEEDTVSGADSSALSSNVGPQSYRSGSDISNNPRLLGMVEDTIKRIILPEINSIKEDQKTDRNLRSFDSSRRGSILDDMYSQKGGLERRVSKSSSTPNISSKPKVVLNRDSEDPGTVLSRGDSERKKSRKSSRGSYTEERPSSRRSSGKHSSRRESYDDEDTVCAKSSQSSTKLRDAAAAGMAGGLLTAAALKHHDSRSEDGRKRRSKSRSSRSRSAGIAESTEDSHSKGYIPPMPMASHINDSDLTRESIVSDIAETPQSAASAGTHTPVHNVSRGSLKDAMSPISSRTPTRTPVSRNVGVSQTNMSLESPRSPYSAPSAKDRVATLAGTGAAGGVAAKGIEEGYDQHVDADGYGSSPSTQRKISSPVQSVSSLKKNFEEDTSASKDTRPRSAASRSSAGQSRDLRASQTSLRSGISSPNARSIGSNQQSRDIGEAGYGPGTPTYGESVDDWYERQHQLNDRYRDSVDFDEGVNPDSFAERTNRDSYQTNPYPQDEKRFTFFSEDGQDSPALDNLDEEQDVRGLGVYPEYIHTPHGAESAVASLIMEPSTTSSNKLSSPPSSSKMSQSERMNSRLRELGKDAPPLYEGSTLSQTMPSQERWAAIRGHARNMSGTNSKDDVPGFGSPRQSPAKSLREERSVEEQPVMSASGLPMADDPLPEIGHFDDSKSDVTTDPSIIHGPLGGDATGKDTWPYTPEPPTQAERDFGRSDEQSLKSDRGNDFGLMGAAAAGATALAAAHADRQPTVEDEYDQEQKLTPDVGRRGEYIDREATPTSPAAFRDEGYVTDAGHARSAGSLTPPAEQRRYNKNDIAEYNRAMDAYDGQEEDPFTGNAQRARDASANSHGMASPLYDSATGKGVENIQSKDVVALMDHLTVRDAQRNARDTEILVTLVRTAAEMRQNFDEMKRFIAEQDSKIMQNADRGADQTVQKVLGGPRPQPLGSPRTPRQSDEEIQTKRKGVLRRALKGLTGSKSSNDLAKVENMLMHILDNVEDLKHQGTRNEPTRSYTNDSLDTYERLRNAPDSGYEPEGQAGTSSTASHSGYFSITPRGEKQQYHSGYDGRRGSVNRVSTVLEGDEEDLEPHESHVLDHQFENNERLLTPTQDVQRQRGFSPSNTPPHQAATYNNGQANDLTPRSTEKQQKHKSNSSSVFGGVPKISRWSKTTASSAPDPATLDSPGGMRNDRALSETSRSGSALDGYDDEPYELKDDDRLRSTQSLAREQERRSMRSQASTITRTPSPLIPSEASIKHQDYYEDVREPSPIQEDLDPEFDDPKYQAHRNSLLLQHPQPRQGPTGRHQNTLETQAHEYDPISAASSDVSQRTVSDFDPALWGSSGTAGLAKHRLSQLEPLSPVSMNSPPTYGGSRMGRDDGPLVPQQKSQVPPKVPYEPEPEPEPEWEPNYSNSGFSRGNYYNSPFGSGHLLEPIEEVRYSLETDSGHVSEARPNTSEIHANVFQLSPEPQVASAKAVDMRSPARKITGPRPMGSRSSSGQQPKLVENTGTVRRKPIRSDYS